VWFRKRRGSNPEEEVKREGVEKDEHRPACRQAGTQRTQRTTEKEDYLVKD
jgi:hypothetical protein